MRQTHTQSGFSLVETLVAITILLIVIVGPLTIVTTTSKSTNFSNAQVVGFYLAQEGAELAQKARDDIVLNRFLDSSDGDFDDTPWVEFIDESNGAEFEDCFISNGSCALEIGEDSEGTIAAPISCGASPNTPCKLYYDTDASNVRSRYTHDSVTGDIETPYKRLITFENVDAGGTDEIRVVSRVEWSTGISRDFESVEVVTYLFDIYGN